MVERHRPPWRGRRSSRVSERECARCPVLQGHGEVIVVVVDDLAVIVRRLVVLLLGELARRDFDRAGPLREVPGDGDPVDA